jgi:hypothetical protein
LIAWREKVGLKKRICEREKKNEGERRSKIKTTSSCGFIRASKQAMTRYGTEENHYTSSPIELAPPLAINLT